MGFLVAVALGCILSSKPKEYEYDFEDYCMIYGDPYDTLSKTVKKDE